MRAIFVPFVAFAISGRGFVLSGDDGYLASLRINLDAADRQAGGPGGPDGAREIAATSDPHAAATLLAI
jgi:hypothetical protein